MTPWLLRGGALLLSAATTALLPAASPGVWAAAAIATLLALRSPGLLGALPVLAVDIVAWAGGYAVGTTAPLARSAAFAAALYLTCSAVALLAAVAPAPRVPFSLVRRWAVRCVPGVAAAVVAAAAAGLVGRVRGSVGLELAGLVAAVLAVVLLVRARG